MKKILLSSFLAIGSFFFAQEINTGFEQSEGYVLGNLSGQNIWGSTSVAHTTVVSAEDAKTGTRSVKITPSTTQATGGAITETNYIYASQIVLEFDFKLTSAAYQTWWMITPQDPDNNSIVGRVVLGADIDELIVVDYNDAGALAYTETGAAFTRDAWHNVKMVTDFDMGQIYYYLDGTLVYTGEAVAGTGAIGNLVLANDNYDGLGAAFIDNVKLYEAPIAGVNDIKKSAFSVFPNPTADFLNVSSKSKVESAQVYDLSGKAINVAVSNNQIDVRNLAKGSYVIKIQTAEGSSTQKFIKK